METQEVIETKRLKQLKECSFLTGSVRWGCDDPRDEDYILLFSDWDSIVGTTLGDFTYNRHEYEHDEFQAYNLLYNGINYNFIIPRKDEELFVWMRASYMMDSIPVQYIQNKGARVHLFEVFKSLIRKEFDKSLTLEEKIERYTGTEDDIPF